MVYEAQKELKDTLEQKKAVIETDIRCEARVIPFQFRQLLMNLISNSLKFQQKDKPPRIRILAERLNGNNINRKDIDPEKVFCHLSIRDNGIGFEEIYKDRIFEVFQRLHGKDEYEGTGVGLAIVKKIAENHQGWIEVSSESGKGSSFDIYFPQ
jgi:signal transduction histidine kinase